MKNLIGELQIHYIFDATNQEDILEESEPCLAYSYYFTIVTDSGDGADYFSTFILLEFSKEQMQEKGIEKYYSY